MYERRVLRNNSVSIFIFFILLQILIRSLNADYVVKEISNPERKQFCFNLIIVFEFLYKICDQCLFFIYKLKKTYFLFVFFF